MRSGDRFNRRKIQKTADYLNVIYDRRILNLILPKDRVKPPWVRFLN